MTARRARAVLRGASATIILVALVAGLPVVLYAVGGSPVPSRMPSWHRIAFALLHQDNGRLFLGAVRDVAWLAWAAFTVAVLAEVQAVLRRRRAPSLRLAGLQGAAGRLVASAALMFSAPATLALAVPSAVAANARPIVPPAPDAHAAAARNGVAGAGQRAGTGQRAGGTGGQAEVGHVEAASGEHDRTGADAARERTVVVRPGDCLWTIAERYLGSGERFHEIVSLNLGRDMGGGRVFEDPSVILPGWRLLVPAASASPRSPGAGHEAAAGHEGSGAGGAHGTTGGGRAGGGHGQDPAGHPPGHGGHPSKDPRFRHPHRAAGSPAPAAPAPVGAGDPQAVSKAAPALLTPGSHSQIPEFALFSLGLLAGGALASLDRLRHRQRQHRRPGRRIVLPADEAGWRIERKLRAAIGRLGPLVWLGVPRFGSDRWPDEEDSLAGDARTDDLPAARQGPAGPRAAGRGHQAGSGRFAVPGRSAGGGRWPDPGGPALRRSRASEPSWWRDDVDPDDVGDVAAGGFDSDGDEFDAGDFDQDDFDSDDLGPDGLGPGGLGQEDDDLGGFDLDGRRGGWDPGGGEHEDRPRLPTSLPEALRALGDALAASGDALPPIVGVHLTPRRLEILLSAPAAVPPPPPFLIAPARQAMCWTVGLDGGGRRAARNGGQAQQAGPPEPGEIGDLLPGLFTAGATDGGGFLLLDLEALRVTCCDGPDDLTDRLLVTAATELAASQWSGWYDLILVGCDELEILGRAEQCGDLDQALGLLEAKADTVATRIADGGPADVRTRRLADPEDEDWGLTLLVSRDQPTPEQMARLLDLADGPGGIAALVAGDTQAEDGKLAPALIQLAADQDQPGEMTATISMAHLGPDHQIVVWPQTLTIAEYEALAGVLAAASVTDDVSPGTPPYDDYGGPPWIRLAAAPVAPAGYRDGGQATAVSLPRGRGGPVAPGGHGEREYPDDPGLLRRLEVRVLGPAEILGSAEALQPKQAELVLALALHAPVGLSNSALCALLGADDDHPRPADAVRQLITRTRRRLGKAPDGREYIVHLGSGIYVLQEDARLDWGEFSNLAVRGRAERDVGDLRAAMALVRGQPFTGCYHWWIDTGLVETMRAEIIDTAELLATIELGAGRPRAAARSARAGLAAEPAAEQLWRVLMRAEHEAGNPDGVSGAWTGCLDAIAEIAPGADPHPDTERLYRRLTRGAVSAGIR